MDYSVFVEKAKEQDSRNVFNNYTGSLDAIPDDLKPFYRDYNPTDVEIDGDGSGIRFYPVADLHELQNEYRYIKAQFIFATCNGDPVFLNNGQVYTCPHGVKEPKWESLANSFDEYLSKLLG